MAYILAYKNDRLIKVTARGLHLSCDKDELVKMYLKVGRTSKLDVNILKIERINQTNRESNWGLSLFMLTSDVVIIETFCKNKQLIPQCKRCQEFNHTRSYCLKTPMYVRCAGKHLTINCNGSKTTTQRPAILQRMISYKRTSEKKI